MITIAWDVDDVLNDLMRCWLEKKWLTQHPECAVTYADIINNPPHELLGASVEEYLASLDEFRLSGQYQRLFPLPELKEWFSCCGHSFRHLVITAVPVNTACVSAEWVFRHFGAWIRTFHFVPSLRAGQPTPQYDKNKKDFLKWLDKVDIFIDDNEANLRACEELGTKRVLFPRPWNSSKLTISETLKNLK